MGDSQSILLPLQVVDEDQVRPEVDAAIRQLLCECFPADAKVFASRRAWNDVRPAYSILAWHGDIVVGQVGIIERQITCGTESILIAGIQSLAVAVDWRRSGLSQRLMTASMDEARRRGIRFGLLFCLPKLSHFYAGVGWKQSERSVVMRDATGRTVPLPAKNICMDLALDGEPLPPGAIDLEGRDW